MSLTDVILMLCIWNQFCHQLRSHVTYCKIC